MKILCPSDFSLPARAAAWVAIELAVRTAGTVELLHVVPSPAGDVLALATGAAVVDGQIRTTGQMRLAAERRELCCGAGVETTSWLADGDVESAIIARAAAIEADLIVMAAHGGSAWERLALGSTAERVVRRADRPVLIVPAQASSFDLGACARAASRAPAPARGCGSRWLSAASEPVRLRLGSFVRCVAVLAATSPCCGSTGRSRRFSASASSARVRWPPRIPTSWSISSGACVPRSSPHSPAPRAPARSPTRSSRRGASRPSGSSTRRAPTVAICW